MENWEIFDWEYTRTDLEGLMVRSGHPVICPDCKSDYVDKQGVCHTCQKQTIKLEGGERWG
jgi:hypothetical protein